MLEAGEKAATKHVETGITKGKDFIVLYLKISMNLHLWGLHKILTIRIMQKIPLY